MAITMHFEYDIAAPPERVWEVITNADEYAHWMKGFVRIEKLTEGEYGVGTKWREVRKMMGMEAGELFEVREATPAQTLYLYCDGTQGSSGQGAYHFRYVLEPTAGGTRLKVHGEIDPGGGFRGFMSSLFAGSMKSAINADMVAMKKHIESAN